jgi:hypothetical protein
MRLIDLKPRWWALTGRHGQGVSFDCPHCVEARVARPQRIAVAFENPLDGGERAPDDTHWTRTGDTFDGLTLNPSIDGSHLGHWHGWVTAGAIS